MMVVVVVVVRGDDGDAGDAWGCPFKRNELPTYQEVGGLGMSLPECIVYRIKS